MEYKLLSKEEYTKYLPQIRELFKRSFNRDIDEKYLVWRYIKNIKEDLLVCVAFYGDRIVGNYSVFPCDLICEGKTIKAGLSMTTMTDPEFAGRGIFTGLAEKIYCVMKEKEYKIVFGFPNNNSHRIFKERLNWKDIYELPTMSLKEECINNIKNKPVLIKEDNEFCLDYSNIFNLDPKIKVYKNKNYLKWRYFNNPINTYINYVVEKDNKVICNCVIKFYEEQMDIVDINSIDNNYFELLLREIIYINRKKIKQVNTWIQVESSLHNIYEKLGFINMAPITYFGAKVLDNSVDNNLFNYNNWNIKMGDSDVY